MRRKNLSEQSMTEVEIDGLIDRDSGEEIEHGQQVGKLSLILIFFLRLVHIPQMNWIIDWRGSCT